MAQVSLISTPLVMSDFVFICFKKTKHCKIAIVCFQDFKMCEKCFFLFYFILSTYVCLFLMNFNLLEIIECNIKDYACFQFSI